MDIKSCKEYIVAEMLIDLNSANSGTNIEFVRGNLKIR